MEVLYDIFVPGEPKGQPRPRAFAFHGKARVYDPGTAEHWKAQIALALTPDGIVSTDKPTVVELVFKMPRPKSHYTSKGVLRESAPWDYTKKPDCDNLAKAVLDALTTLGVWRDDAQVCVLNVRKEYAEQPGCHIHIRA